MIKHKTDLQRKFIIATTDRGSVLTALGDALVILVISRVVRHKWSKKLSTLTPMQLMRLMRLPQHISIKDMFVNKFKLRHPKLTQNSESLTKAIQSKIISENRIN